MPLDPERTMRRRLDAALDAATPSSRRALLRSLPRHGGDVSLNRIAAVEAASDVLARGGDEDAVGAAVTVLLEEVDGPPVVSSRAQETLLEACLNAQIRVEEPAGLRLVEFLLQSAPPTPGRLAVGAAAAVLPNLPDLVALVVADLAIVMQARTLLVSILNRYQPGVHRHQPGMQRPEGAEWLWRALVDVHPYARTRWAWAIIAEQLTPDEHRELRQLMTEQVPVPERPAFLHSFWMSVAPETFLVTLQQAVDLDPAVAVHLLKRASPRNLAHLCRRDLAPLLQKARAADAVFARRLVLALPRDRPVLRAPSTLADAHTNPETITNYLALARARTAATRESRGR